MALWVMLAYGLKEICETGADPCNSSCAEIWREIRETMRDFDRPVKPGARLRQRLRLAVTDDYIRKDKTSRNYPRKKQEKPAGAPQIRDATKAQVQLAKELLSEQRPKGLPA